MAVYQPYQPGTYRQPIYRAAIIPYFFDQNGSVQMMFMKPSDPMFGGPDFQIAKGHVDPGEQPEAAAVREGGEELGLKPSNIKSIFHLGRFLKYTDVYCCEIGDVTDFDPYEDETGEVTWMTVEYFAHIGRDIHRDIVDQAYTEITSRQMEMMFSS
jgi:8-oxo-dGTP pyrophosphatase MutT (NUDIX family)